MRDVTKRVIDRTVDTVCAVGHGLISEGCGCLFVEIGFLVVTGIAALVWKLLTRQGINRL